VANPHATFRSVGAPGRSIPLPWMRMPCNSIPKDMERLPTIFDGQAKTYKSLEAASNQAVGEDHEHKQGHHYVEPVTLDGKSHHREGNTSHRSGDQEQEPELD
jgi:hypothetical protein